MNHVHTFERSDVYCDSCGGYYDDILPKENVSRSTPKVSAASAVDRYRKRFA